MKAGSPRSWASGCTGCSSKVEIFCVQLWVVWTKYKERRHEFHTKKQIKFRRIAVLGSAFASLNSIVNTQIFISFNIYYSVSLSYSY